LSGAREWLHSRHRAPHAHDGRGCTRRLFGGLQTPTSEGRLALLFYLRKSSPHATAGCDQGASRCRATRPASVRRSPPTKVVTSPLYIL
jgi:hypothetical protein